jgi:hypothetical protein
VGFPILFCLQETMTRRRPGDLYCSKCVISQKPRHEEIFFWRITAGQVGVTWPHVCSLILSNANYFFFSLYLMRYGYSDQIVIFFFFCDVPDCDSIDYYYAGSKLAQLAWNIPLTKHCSTQPSISTWLPCVTISSQPRHWPASKPFLCSHQVIWERPGLSE